MAASRGRNGEGRAAGVNVFAYLLPGLTAVFLLFMADNAVRDLYREGRFGTLERFRTIRQNLIGFIAAKVLFALVILLMASTILLGGGSWLFGFSWRLPLPWPRCASPTPSSRPGSWHSSRGWRARNARGPVEHGGGHGTGLAGGCMFPAEQLPAFLRELITPYMPTRWFVAARELQSGLSGRCGCRRSADCSGWDWPASGRPAAVRPAARAGHPRMKAIFEIARNDLRLFLRERTSWIWLVVVPLAFVYFMGFAARGPGGPVTPTAEVRIENLDDGLFGSAAARDAGGTRPARGAAGQRGGQTRHHHPAEFTERVLARQQVDLDFFKVGDADDAAAAMVELRLVRALIVMNSLLVEHAIASTARAPRRPRFGNFWDARTR
jgi:hypothetical protein